MSFAFVHLALYFLRRNLYASVVDSSNVNAILDSYLKLLLILAFSVSADPDRRIELSQFFFKFYSQNSADTTIMYTMQLTFHVELRAALHPGADAVAAALAGESDVVLDAIQLSARPGS